MSRLAQDIILRPVITENSMDGIADRKYTFEVAKDANKVEIKAAVEKLCVPNNFYIYLMIRVQLFSALFLHFCIQVYPDKQ